MRIAWFSHRYFPCIGGAENYGRAIVRRFVAAGHGVDVFTSDAHDLRYFTDKGRTRVDAPRVSSVDGADVRRFAVRHVPLQRYLGRALSYVPHWPTRCRFESYMPILPGIERVRGDYDAVFAVGFPYTVFSLAALRTAREARSPLLLTPFLHLATPGDPVSRLYSRPHQSRLLSQADAVIVQTGLEAEAVARRGVPKARILTLGMGVEHAEVTGGDGLDFRTRQDIPRRSPVIGHLATLDPDKGTTDLVRALERINAGTTAENRAYLVLAGPSTARFEAFAAGLASGTRRWLRVIGPLAPGDRPGFFAALDAFAMPSRTDSFGIVFLEAWANGLPVVAAAAGGVVEVVEHGRTGVLVPFGAVEELASAIGGLLADPARARGMGEAGRALVARGYSWDDRFATLDGWVRSLVKGRASKRCDGVAG